jgi:hypothetical protein
MFRAFSRPSSGAQRLQYQPLVLPSYRGDSSAVGRGRTGRPDHDQQHCYYHDTKVKPEAATAVVELLMMGGRMPETCWAVNKRQDNKLKNCCIWLVIYLNYFISFLIPVYVTPACSRARWKKMHPPLSSFTVTVAEIVHLDLPVLLYAVL